MIEAEQAGETLPLDDLRVPPTKFRGVVERVNGIWTARVTDAVFAT
jgi:hypothetical protein